MHEASSDHEVVVRVSVGPQGRPVRASAVRRFEHTPAEIWAVLSDVERFARHLPMVRRATRQGDDVTFDLRFKVSVLSVGFQFCARASYDEARWLELRWISGEPRDIRLRFDLTAEDDGRACVVSGAGEFDVLSLGWLAKYFLKNHPEIALGIFPGVALALVGALDDALDASNRSRAD